MLAAPFHLGATDSDVTTDSVVYLKLVVSLPTSSNFLSRLPLDITSGRDGRQGLPMPPENKTIGQQRLDRIFAANEFLRVIATAAGASFVTTARGTMHTSLSMAAATSSGCSMITPGPASTLQKKARGMASRMAAP